MTDTNQLPPLPTMQPGDSHMESLIEAAIQGHADTREAMRWLVRQLVPATQAEAHPGEPVYQICKADSVSISTAWVDVQKQQYDDAAVYPEYGRRVLYTHPAPGEPDDVAQDAERYRWLRSLEHCNEAWCLIGSGNANSNLDAAIDAAMLAAQAQKGGE